MSNKLYKPIRQNEKLGSNSLIYSNTKKRNIFNKKI